MHLWNIITGGDTFFGIIMVSQILLVIGVGVNMYLDIGRDERMRKAEREAWSKFYRDGGGLF